MAKTNKNAPKTNRKTKKAETPITIANYQKLAMRTCLPACECWAYAFPALMSEMCEFFAKHYGQYAKSVRGDFDDDLDCGFENYSKIRKEIKKELGDIAWSLALICKVGGYKFCKELELAKKKGELHLVKMFLEDNIHDTVNAITFGEEEKKRRTMEFCFHIFASYCHYYRFKVSDVLRDNIRKLASRQKRGVIMGNGDNR